MKTIKRQLSKTLIYFVALSTILWTMSGALIMSVPAEAAVTVTTVDNWMDHSQMVGPDWMSPVFALKITGSAGETLNSITVQLSNLNGVTNPTDVLDSFNAAGAGGANDEQGLSIYKDTNGNGWFDPDYDSVLAWEAQPSWSGAGPWTASLDVANDNLPSSLGSSISYNYFIHLRTASALTAGNSFTLGLLTDAIVTSANSPTITATATGSISAMGGNTGGGGVWQTPPNIKQVVYMDYHRVALIFDKPMGASANCNSLDTCSAVNNPKYSITTAYDGETETERISSAVAQDDCGAEPFGGDCTVVLTADNTVRLSPSWTDGIQVSTDFASAPRSLDNLPNDSGGWWTPMPSTDSNLKISEVYLNGTAGFIELYNPGPGIVNISGWMLIAIESNGTLRPLAVLPDADIQVGGHYLIGGATYTHPSVTVDASFNFTGVDPFPSGVNFSLVENTSYVISDNTVPDRNFIDMVGIGPTAPMYEGSRFTDYSSEGLANQSIQRKAKWDSTFQTMANADASFGNSYDSNDNSWDWFEGVATEPQSISSNSATESPNFGGGYQNCVPWINHMPLPMATTNQSVNVMAEINDCEDTASQLAQNNENGAAKLWYSTNSGSSWSSVNGMPSFGNNFQFTIPGSVTSGASISYYLYAKDSANQEVFNAATPNAASEPQARANPFRISLSSTTGTRSISGYVKSGSSCNGPEANANVFIPGTGQSTTTNNNGVFSFTNVPDGSWNLQAMKGGFNEAEIWGVNVNMNNPNSSGWTFCMQSGTGGQGGDSVGPQVIWTAPNEGMMGAPMDIGIARAPILIGFDQTLDSSTVTCSNCDAATANIKFKKIVGGTPQNVTGYNVGVDTGSGFQAREFGGSTNSPVVVIAMEAPLIKAADYIVEITPAVKDAAGNPVSGNRPGGGHSFMFTTMNSDWNFGATGGGGFGSFENEGFWAGGDFSQMMNDTSYQTMAGKYNAGTGQWSGGEYNPPYIFGSMPGPGSWDVATNLDQIVFEFSEPIDGNTVNKANFKLYSVANNGTEADITSTKIDSVSLSNSKTIVTMNVGSAGLSAGDYRVKVMAGVRGTSGITLGDPNHPEWEYYRSDFNVGSSADNTPPTIAGSYPDNGATNVPLDFGFVNIGFSEALNPNSVTTQTASLKLSNTTVPATVEYDTMGQSIKIFPSSGLMPGGTYTIALTNGITDLAGKALVAVNGTFTMSTIIDTTRPRVEFANCDDYTCAITFSKPMNATRASESSVNAAQWSASVLKPSNYALQYGSIGNENTVVDLTAAGVSFQYDYEGRTIMIEGWSNEALRQIIRGISSPHFVMTVTGVKDIMDNPIDTANFNNIAKGPLGNSADTMGFIGMGGGGFMGAPGASGGGAMMGGGSTGMTASGFGGYTASDMGTMPVGVFPMNSMAGVTTTYFIDFPISANKAINDGGYIKLTFPVGFNVASAIPDSYNPNNKDFNMMGGGTVTWGTVGGDGITVSGQTVTITLDITGNNEQTSAPDFMHIEIKNIVNNTIPKDFNTSGYTVDMKSYSLNNTLLESKTSMPFFISEAGNNIITLNPITATGGGNNSFSLMMGSPMTGPMDADVTLSGGIGSQTWPNLPDGCYNIFTEPTITLGINKYQGQMNPEPICVNGGQTVTRGLTLDSFASIDGAVALPVTIYGDFGVTEDIDVFAGGPGAFMVETKNDVGNVSANGTIATLYLTRDGEYMIGMGPAMPKGPMMGPPPMPNWMPPMNIQVKKSGSTLTRVDTMTTITELSFNVANANLLITGWVINDADGDNVPDSGEEISNAQLWANQPFGFGGMGSYAQSQADGTFTLRVAEVGVYDVGSFLPGMGDAPMTSVEVQANDVNVADGNSSADIYVNGQLVTTSNRFLVKIYKPDYTISGKVMDASGNALQYAHLMAEEPTTHQMTHTGTDSNGSYILYVSAGAWTITADMPSGTDTCGVITKQATVSSSTGNLSNQNLRPDSTVTCYTLSGTVTIGTVQSSIPVMIETWDVTNDRPAGGYNRNEMTDSNGQFRVKVGANTVIDANNDGINDQIYRVSTWSPDNGEIGTNVFVSEAVDVADGQNDNAITANITHSADAMKTLTVTYTGGTANMQGFLEAKSTTGSTRRGMPINGLNQSLTLTLPADTYNVFTHIKGIGGFSQSAVDLTSDQTVTFNLSASTLYTVSGTVLDANNNPLKGTSVTLIDETTGLQTSAATDSNGNYSVVAKSGAYSVKASKSGYSSPAKATLTVSGNVDYDFDSNTTGEDVAVDNDLIKNSQTIAGVVYQSGTTTPVNEGVVYATSSDGKFAKTTIDRDGTYDLGVTTGTWTVTADAPLHAATNADSAVVVGSNDTIVSAAGFDLASDLNDVKKLESRTVTPSIGATFDNTDDVGLKAVFGQNVLGRDSNPGSVVMETVDAPTTDQAVPMGEVVEVDAKDNSNNAITKLNGNGAEITMTYTDADVSAAGVSESQLKLSYYDPTTETWEALDGVVDTANNTITAYITHLTTIGITHPPVTQAAPPRRIVTYDQPSGGGGGSGGTTGGGTTGGEVKKEEVKKEEVKQESEKPAEQVEAPQVPVAPVQVITEAEAQPKRAATPDLVAERTAISEVIKLVGVLPSTSNDWDKVKYLAYGTPATQAKPMAERVSIAKDYKEAYGKMPETAKEWHNLDKIARGDSPLIRDLTKEAKNLSVFVKYHNRLPVTGADWKFAEFTTYMLRPIARDIPVERIAIGKFRSANSGALPATSSDWAVVRALAYASGETEIAMAR